MSYRTLILASIFLVLVGISFTLDDILEQMRRWEIAVESRGDAAAVSASRLPDPGTD